MTKSPKKMAEKVYFSAIGDIFENIYIYERLIL